MAGNSDNTVVRPFIVAAALGRAADAVLARWKPGVGLIGFGAKGNRVDGTPPPPYPAEVMLLEASFAVWQQLNDHGVANCPWPSEIDEAAGRAFARVSGVSSLCWFETRHNVNAHMIAARMRQAAEITMKLPSDGGVKVRKWS